MKVPIHIPVKEEQIKLNKEKIQDFFIDRSSLFTKKNLHKTYFL